MTRTVLLGDICQYITDKVSVNDVSLNDYISTENLLPEKAGVTLAAKLPQSGKVTRFKKGDVLVSNIRPYFKKIWFADRDGGASNDVLVFRKTTDAVNERYLHYILANDKFFDYSTASSGGSKMPRGDKVQIMKYPVYLPDINDQKKIADILGMIDEKIELNRKMNDTLEQMGQALFKKYFINNPAAKTWPEKSLDEIAIYLNGLAMQKYPKIDGMPTLPVIKIREMSSGITANTDIASAEIPEKYVVHNGDLLFSWSGTLMVKFWSEGDGALNQHLFKVTSNQYPEWLYYFWTKHHLDDFIRTAKSKATTMGHIQRVHLRAAKVLVPNENMMHEIGDQIQPIIDLQKANSLQINTLTSLRDNLLPRLISGNIKL